MKRNSLTIISLLLICTSHAQSILCFSAEDSTSIKSFDVYAASDDFTFSSKKLEKENLETYLNTPICLRALGFRDTCFVLQKNTNRVFLRLNTGTLKTVEVAGAFDVYLDFIKTLEAFKEGIIDQDEKILVYEMTLRLDNEKINLHQSLEGTVQIKHFPTKKRQHFLDCYYQDLKFTEVFQNPNSDPAIDSLSITNNLHSKITESFWTDDYNIKKLQKYFHKFKKHYQFKRESQANKKTYASRFFHDLNKSRIAINTIYMQFDEKNRLLEVYSLDSLYINPVRRNIIPRNLVSSSIVYTSTGRHCPQQITIIEHLDGNPDYKVTLELKLIDAIDAFSFPERNNFVIHPPVSTKAWLRYNGITGGG
ncbi:MAG: hypothetical protein ACK4WD_05020 [Flavobacteriales bacterium]|jgi:hypothetical protein